MKESYRFYQNKACEYFPCHPVDDPDSFNCLFCYCPLYLQEKWPCSPEWILSGKGQKNQGLQQLHGSSQTGNV